MKAVDVGRKIFDLISTSGSGTHNVIDISFVQGWFRSRELSEDLFLDMPHEQTRIIRSPYIAPSLSVSACSCVWTNKVLFVLPMYDELQPWQVDPFTAILKAFESLE